ncbi:MAG TPA: hypothetical protein PLK30_15020 [Blastocatellia bacterium]|nr:hypothetical protein [Blastocatellia bacterium]
MCEEEFEEDIVRAHLHRGEYESAIEVAGTVECDWQRADLFAEIARTLSKAGMAPLAEGTWKLAVAAAREGELSESSQDSHDASSVLWEISEDMATAGNWDDGERVASGIRSELKRRRAVDNLEAMKRGGRGAFASLRTPSR